MNQVKRNFIKISILFFITTILNNCLDTDLYDEHDQKVDNINYNPDIKILNLIKSSLSNNYWQIDLKVDNIGYNRNYTKFKTRAMNPKNWITITDDNCEAMGVPQSIKDNCIFKKSSTILALCYVRGYGLNSSNVGQIIDTTILIRRENFSNLLLSDDFKRSIVVHEIGHCLGLQHWGKIDKTEKSGLEPEDYISQNLHIMYPQLNNQKKIIPNYYEQKAIQAVYANTDFESCSNINKNKGCINPKNLSNIENCNLDPNVPPNIPVKIYETYLPCYFSNVRNENDENTRNFNYQPTFPEFYISASIGNGLTTDENIINSLEPGQLIEKDASVIDTYYYIKSTDDGFNEIIEGGGGGFFKINNSKYK